jgi:hypothetical protein
MKDNATLCTTSTECASGHCVDGVCCDGACTGQCEACDVGGSEGTCTPVTKKPHGARAKCDDKADADCAKTECDGSTRTRCDGFANGGTTPCGADACTADHKLQKAGKCDGHGACSLPDVTPCLPYLCDDAKSACKATCTSNADCSDTYRCDTEKGLCVQGATCSDDKTQSIGKDGTVSDCAPYVCGTEGICLQRCTKADDCVPGSSCDDARGACVVVSKETVSTDSGGCDVGGVGASRGGLAGVALGLLGLVARRRRRAA